MIDYKISPAELVIGLWGRRDLIGALVKREVLGRYRGSILGILWSFFNPILMLMVYTFVFSVVFKAKWSSTSDSKTEFALVLFAGLIIFNLFAECVNKAPSVILSNVNYVKRVVFPLEILCWVNLGAALFHASVSTFVWVVVYTVLFGFPHLTILLLPIVILPLLFLIMGLSWALASLGVYLRDVSQFVIILTSVLMFLSPIFYPVTALPDRYKPIISLNPLTEIIEQSRAVMFYGHSIDWGVWSMNLLGSAIIAWIGFAWFQKTRKGFADVL